MAINLRLGVPGKGTSAAKSPVLQGRRGAFTSGPRDATISGSNRGRNVRHDAESIQGRKTLTELSTPMGTNWP